MKKLPMLLLLIFCIPVLGLGAQIYGNLRANNASVGEGVAVRIQCDGTNYDGRTDAYGSYSVGVPQSKTCRLSVNYSGSWSDPFAVYPDDDPVRYDFDLLRQNNGALILTRR
jgi:hypothetical protein